MTKGSRVALCLYALYGDPTDCKLALLVGGRGYGDFRNHALKFVFNLFYEGSSLPVKPVNEFIKYICQIQENYLEELQNRGFTLGHPFYGQDTQSLESRHIEANHDALSAMDGTYGSFSALKTFADRLDGEWMIPDETWKMIETAIIESHTTLRQLERFADSCELHNIEPVQSPDQAMAEFMEFLTHIARGCLFHLRDDDATALHDLSAGIVHLKRNILDMRKSIITTIFMKYVGKISEPLIRKLLAARIEELSYGPNDLKKLFLYKDEVNELLNFFQANA